MSDSEDQPDGPIKCELNGGIVTPCWALSEVARYSDAKRGVVQQEEREANLGLCVAAPDLATAYEALWEEREGHKQRIAWLENRLAAVTDWLQHNQPDVFQRGLWDAASDGVKGLPLGKVARVGDD